MNVRRLWILPLLCLFVPLLAAQQNNDWAFRNAIPPAHTGPVTALFISDGEIVSAGEDGFLEIWDISGLTARERFQLSSSGIESMIKRPGADEICLLESDGLGLYRISVWNFRQRKKMFSLRFTDPITYINYSAAGNFIIAARTGRNGLVFIDSRTGNLLKAPETMSTSAVFAATGRSERVMLAYFSSGQISYWNLETGEETSRFETLPNLASVVMFGNNRYFAGVDSSGFVAVLDAVSGAELARRYVSPDALLYASADDLFCMIPGGDRPGVYLFSVDRRGNIAERDFFRLTENFDPACVFSADGGGIALGTSGGGMILLGSRGQRRFTVSGRQTSVVAAAVSGTNLAFLTSDHELGFLPLNYSEISGGMVLSLEKHEGYSEIGAVGENGGNGQFLLWQDGNTDTFPLIVSADAGTPSVFFTPVPLRFPLRCVRAAYGKLLLLDSAGNLTVLSPDGETSQPFSFSAAGATDAAFIDKDNILLCRAAILGNTPFVMLNITNGETVPLAWPSQAGIMSHTTESGVLYAVTIEDSGEGGSAGIKTSIIKLNTAVPSQSVRMLEFSGEDTLFSMAGAGELLAATIGGEGASVFGPDGMRPFERTPGLPAQLSGGNGFFVSLDTEGNLCWHDARSGRLETVFKLYGSQWTLQTPRETRYGTVNAGM